MEKVCTVLTHPTPSCKGINRSLPPSHPIQKAIQRHCPLITGVGWGTLLSSPLPSPRGPSEQRTRKTLYLAPKETRTWTPSLTKRADSTKVSTEAPVANRTASISPLARGTATPQECAARIANQGSDGPGLTDHATSHEPPYHPIDQYTPVYTHIYIRIRTRSCNLKASTNASIPLEKTGVQTTTDRLMITIPSGIHDVTSSYTRPMCR